METQLESTKRIVAAIAGAIKELGSVPSGHLYARVMGILSIDQYNTVIGILKKQGLITESHYLLTWVDSELDYSKPGMPKLG